MSTQKETSTLSTETRRARSDVLTGVRSVLRRRTIELDAIRDIFRAINATADLRSILNTITHTTARAIRADSTSIYLLQPATKKLVLKATTGLYPQAVDHASLELGQGLTGWAALHRQPVAVRDAWADPRFYPLPGTREKPFKSLLAVPLISQDRVIGAMNIQTHQLRSWSEGDVEFAALIADVVAGVLERAVLYEETERRMRELAAVAEVSRAVIAPNYVDETLRVVAEMAAHALGARRCSLLLLDEDERAYVPRAVFDEAETKPEELSWPLEHVPLLNVDSLEQAVIVSDARAEMEPAYAQWAERAGLVRLLCVPVTVHERTIGIMNVWSGAAADFSAQQMELASTLANQIGLAIENAHLIGNAAIVREMNHRVKNNLQNIVMLLQLQMNDERKVTAKEVLHESINRIMSIAAVHDALAHEGFRLVDVKDVITRVVSLVRANMVRPDQSLEIEVKGDALRLSSKAATALALCVNELVQNAIEHAFVDRKRGKITITLNDRGGNLEVVVKDDGRGNAGGVSPSPSLGLHIVETLVTDDLRGRFEWKRTAKGSIASITAPIRFT
ncbi:MAG: GAF domain-containing protein [Anaerolineae bacterium]|nr:GAF domain-containing protein [Thermoflexales bacterium]MDW8406595.1 GAF domain-containing protein [Anaerolineae bacterium]